MKINIEKRHALIILTGLIFLAGVIVVIGQTGGVSHDASEIDITIEGQPMTLEDAISQEKFGGGTTGSTSGSVSYEEVSIKSPGGIDISLNEFFEYYYKMNYPLTQKVYQINPDTDKNYYGLCCVFPLTCPQGYFVYGVHTKKEDRPFAFTCKRFGLNHNGCETMKVNKHKDGPSSRISPEKWSDNTDDDKWDDELTPFEIMDDLLNTNCPEDKAITSFSGDSNDVDNYVCCDVGPYKIDYTRCFVQNKHSDNEDATRPLGDTPGYLAVAIHDDDNKFEDVDNVYFCPVDGWDPDWITE